MTNVVKFLEGDKRMETLYQSLETVLFERGIGLPIPALLGILDLLKMKVIDNAKD